MKKEIKLQQQFPFEQKVATLYFGGGTPSILSVAELEELFLSLNDSFDLSQCKEVTLEANPEDITEEKLDAWQSLGVNRLSVGIQSFDDALLRYTNRCHDARQSGIALDRIIDSDFENYTIDLMFGIPGNSLAQWKQDLKKAVDYQVPHLSIYGLTIEPHTVFGRWHENGKLKATSEDEMAEAFELTHEYLTSQGYVHYEVSNYGLPGMESKHNSAYWQGESYLGIGPGAHSFDQASRAYNVSNNAAYIKSLEVSELPQTVEQLTAIDRINEVIFTSLRTNTGLDLSRLMEQHNKDLLVDHGKQIAEWENMGLLELREGCIRLTAKGLLLVDELSVKLFYS